MRALGDTAAAGWPLFASLAVALLGQVRSARRRTALNEALHELRRPLQALVLSRPAAAGTSLALALAALTRLDREINGGADASGPQLLSPRSALEAAAARWRASAARAGGPIELRWEAGNARVLAEPGDFEAAVDNLLANALEHGSPPVLLEASSRAGRLRIAVVDAGGAPPPGPAGPGRGHGLRIVRRFAARQGGRFLLERAPGRTTALLELPLATPGRRSAA